MANTASTTLNGYKIEVEYRPGRGYEFTVYKPDGLGLVRAFSIGEAVRGLELAKQEAAAAGNTALVATLQSLINSFPAEATTLQALVPTAQPTPPESAGQTVNDDATNNPNKPPPIEVGPNGRIKTIPTTTSPTNADQPLVGESSTGTDAPTKSFNKTQATYEGVAGGTMPVPGSSTQSSDANLVGTNGTGTNGTNGTNGTGTNGTNGTNGTGTNGTVGGSTASGNNTGSSNVQTPVTPGVGQNDDNLRIKPAATSRAIDNGYNKSAKITPQPNILDQYPSYTYNVSVYLTNPDQYRKLVTGLKRNVNGYNLLFQSGGAPTNIGGAQGELGAAAAGSNADLEAEGIGFAATSKQTPNSNAPDAGRNPFFPDDFYIESVTLDNAFPGKQTRAAHMVTSLKFTVIEPGGITLIDRIYEAVQDFAPRAAGGKGPINYMSAQYLMVIRWYGYDINGKIVRPGPKDAAGLSDPTASCEKYIPFVITKINWGVNNKLVTYDFECAPIGQMIGGYAARGSIPYDIELTNSTVSGLLGGDAKYGTGAAKSSDPGTKTPAPGTNTPVKYNAARDSQAANTTTAPPAAPPTAAAAPTPKKTITSGLIAAMNKFQKELVDDKTYEYADEYEIVFPPGPPGAPSISDALITLPGKVVTAKSTPMTPAAKTDPKGKDPARQSVDKTARNFSITAGQQILQAIDLAIRNSSYIYNQAFVQKEETPLPDPAKFESGDETDNTIPTNLPEEKTMYWYQITMECIPTEYDRERNDYAYKIKYIVTPYVLQNFNSKYYPLPKFLGLHKQYRYWFTGENSDVLDYQAKFDGLYNMTVSGSVPGKNALNALRKKRISSMREQPKYTYYSASSESRSGADDDANEYGANAGEALYSPSDMASAKLKIVGDPGWIQQGSIAAGVGQQFDYSGFLPDGTINFDATQVLFAIEWQKPQDYNLNTGLADPYAKTKGARKPINSYVYQATKCVSEFRQGKFEQNIEGTIYTFPTPDLKNASIKPKASADSDAGRPSGDKDGKTKTQIDAEFNNTDTSEGAGGTLTSGVTDDYGNPLYGGATGPNGESLSDIPNTVSAPPVIGRPRGGA